MEIKLILFRGAKFIAYTATSFVLKFYYANIMIVFLFSTKRERKTGIFIEGGWDQWLPEQMQLLLTSELNN